MRDTVLVVGSGEICPPRARWIDFAERGEQLLAGAERYADPLEVAFVQELQGLKIDLVFRERAGVLGQAQLVEP